MARVIDKDKLITSMAWHDQQGMISCIDDILDIIEAFPTLTPPNEPLTMEQLRESPHGKIKDSTLESICNRANEIASRPPEGEADA